MDTGGIFACIRVSPEPSEHARRQQVLEAFTNRDQFCIGRLAKRLPGGLPAVLLLLLVIGTEVNQLEKELSIGVTIVRCTPPISPAP
jgi:hypothetical protein